jgi:endonuclease/exonuclease/phosphatase family metal-dependent hydrolase
MRRPSLRRALRPILVVVPVLAAVGVLCPAVMEATLRPVPSELRLVSATTSSMTLRWAEVSGGAGYRVVYSDSAAMTNAQTAEFEDNVGTIEGLRAGRRYWVRVAVTGRTGEELSGYTAPDYPSARTLYPGGYSFRAPKQVRVVTSRLTSLALDWTKVKGAPGYRLQVATNRAMVRPRSAWFREDGGLLTRLVPGRRYFVTVSVAPEDTTAPALSDTSVARVARTRSEVPDSYQLRVASFNISGSLNDTRRNAPWSVRKAYVVRQLLGLAPADQLGPPPDAVALQEANTSRRLASGADQYTELIDGLNAAAPADAHYSGIPGSSNSTRIAYNDRTVELVRSGVLHFGAQEMRADGARMAPWAVFEVLSTKARFFFLSAHLETASERVRRSQWSELIARAPGLSAGLPVVMGGDFNSPRKGRNTTAAAMLPRMRAAGFGDTLGQVGSGMLYTSNSRAHQVVKGNYNSVNRFHRTLNWYPSPSMIGQDVDYLFASNDLEVRRWEMVIDVAGRTLRGVVPSDHNMIRSTLVLPTPDGG